jgi:hypothetical protein
VADVRTATDQALKGLPPELRLAGGAAAALAFTVVLPWYEKSYFATTGDRPVAISDNLSALQVFSFVEAAVLLVAAGVLYLVWARSQKKGFHLPGGDGTVIMAAGGWALLLLVWRLFDKPDVNDPGATVGIQWGMFAALLAAGALTAAGARVRAVHRPEPPNPAADDTGWERPAGAQRRGPSRRPREEAAVTDALSGAPRWEGEPPEAPGRARRPGGSVAAPDDDARARRGDDEPRDAGRLF